MPIPLPKKKLGNHCSAILGDTLYTYSSDAFQSIELKNGSEWRSLPKGVPTEGSACVLADRGTPEEALYIVGGAVLDSESTPEKGYYGLQRFTFANQKWDNVRPVDDVIYNITNHGATFLKETGEIIVFAGTKWPDTGASSSTFLIKTKEPHAVTAISAQTPLLAPMVLPWGGNGALIVGGDAENTALNTFSVPQKAWGQLPLRLDKGLPVRGKAGASLMDGDDGSRLLITFDLTTSPATVLEKQVLPSGGAPQRRSRLGRRQQAGASPAVSTDGQLTAANWPQYDDKGAPEGSREGTSLAYDGDIVVISGGNDKDPLLMFNARKNSWVNAQEVLGTSSTRPDDEDLDVVPSRTPRPGTSPTSSTSASSGATTAAAVGGGGGGGGGGANLTTLQLLFIILGSILGAALLLACVFFFLRKKTRERNPEEHGDKQRLRDGGRMSFQDRGASFMKEAGGSVSPSQGHREDSWAGVQRKASGQTHKGNPFSSQTHLAAPTVQAIGGQGVIISPGTAASPPPGDRGINPTNYGKERSSGWSKYFSGNSATNLGATYPGTVRSSQYTAGTGNSDLYAQNPHLYNAGPGVAAGGIGVAATTIGLHSSGDELRKAERRGSDISMSSIGGDSYSSGIPESINEEKEQRSLWSPVHQNNQLVGNHSSSLYTDNSPSRERWRDTQLSEYSGPPPQSAATEGVDNLSWLNLRQS